MNNKKGDSLIRLIERACHKQTLPQGEVALNKLLDGYALARLKELGICLVIPRKGYAFKELKEVGWPKQTLGKEMN